MVENDIVIDFGDFGSEFFIIMSGKVSVQLPTLIEKKIEPVTTQESSLDKQSKDKLNSLIGGKHSHGHKHLRTQKTFGQPL